LRRPYRIAGPLCAALAWGGVAAFAAPVQAQDAAINDRPGQLIDLDWSVGLRGSYTNDSAMGSLDMLLCNALVIDPVLGIVKGDIGIKDGRIINIGKAGNPAIMNGVDSDLICGTATTVRDAEGKHLPLANGMLRQRMRHRPWHRLRFNLHKGKTLLKAQRLIQLLYRQPVRVNQVLAQSHSWRSFGERRGQLRRGHRPGTHQDLAQLALLRQQCRTRRIGVFGFEPFERLPAHASPGVSRDGLNRRGGIECIGVHGTRWDS